MIELSEKHAIVTGGSRGIGETTARKLAMRGADVTVLARSREPLESLCEDLEHSTDGSFFPAVADVTDPESVRTTLKEAIDHLGTPHMLVNNAGAVRTSPFTNISDSDWEQLLEVNLSGAFYCCQAVLDRMNKENIAGGRIVNVASTAGIRGYPYVAAYTAAKHGLIGLTRSLAKEYASRNITINAVCPGYTDTDLLDESVETVSETTGKPEDKIRNNFKSVNPQNRFVNPEEVASTIAWLCLPEQQSINGETIIIDGGETC